MAEHYFQHSLSSRRALEMNSDSVLVACHELLSGLFISSAQQARLCPSLDLILNPVDLSQKQVTALSDDEKSLVLAAVPSESTGSGPQWVKLDSLKFFPGLPVRYVMSGLAALPLPVWPFYLRGDLSAAAHLESFLSAYFPVFDSEATKNWLDVYDSATRLIVYFPENGHAVYSQCHSGKEIYLSAYLPDLGAVAVRSDQYVTGSTRCRVPLSKDQYSGDLSVNTLTWFSGERSMSCKTYLRRAAAFWLSEIEQESWALTRPQNLVDPKKNLATFASRLERIVQRLSS